MEDKRYICISCEGAKTIKASTVEGESQSYTCPCCYGYGRITLKQLSNFIHSQQINGHIE